MALNVSDVSMCETNRGTWLKECFGSSFNLRSEDEIEIQVESLKNQVDEVGSKLRERVKTMRNELLK